MTRPYAKYIAIATLLVIAILIMTTTTTNAASGTPTLGITAIKTPTPSIIISKTPIASPSIKVSPSPSFIFTLRPSITIRPSTIPSTVAIVAFGSGEVTVAEELNGKVEIKVFRTGNMTTKPEVKVSITDHTATPEYEGGDWDFISDGPSDIARFEANGDYWIYGFEVKDDSIAENDEYFDLTLSEVKYGTIGTNNQMRVWITSAEKPAGASPTPNTGGASPTPDASVQPSPSGNDASPTPDVSASPTTNTDGQTTGGSNAKSGGEFLLLSVVGLALASLVLIRVKKE